jgi:hypothetical protein
VSDCGVFVLAEWALCSDGNGVISWWKHPHSAPNSRIGVEFPCRRQIAFSKIGRMCPFPLWTSWTGPLPGMCTSVSWLKETKTKLHGLSPPANHTDSDCHLSAKLVPTFADRGCHGVRVTDRYCRILGFIDRSSYFFFLNCTHEAITYINSVPTSQETIHLCSVARNSDHKTTEAVYFLLHNIYKFSSYLTGSTIHLRCVARNSDH